MSCMSVTPMTMSMSHEQVGDLVAAGDAAVDVEQTGAGVDLILGQSLDELGIARLDRLGDLLARPVDRFTHQQHLNNLHDDYPGRTSAEYMRSVWRRGTWQQVSADGARSRGCGLDRRAPPKGQTPSGGHDPSGRRRRRSPARRSRVDAGRAGPAALGDAAVDPDLARRRGRRRAS